MYHRARPPKLPLEVCFPLPQSFPPPSLIITVMYCGSSILWCFGGFLASKIRKLPLIGNIALRPWRPGTGPRNGNSKKVLAGCWHKCRQKRGCWPKCWHKCWQAGPFVNRETTRPASTCASTPASTPSFASTPASTFLEFPFQGPIPGHQGLRHSSS